MEHASASTGFNSSANIRIGRNLFIYKHEVHAIDKFTSATGFHANPIPMESRPVNEFLHFIYMIPPCLIPHLITSSESRNKDVQNRPEQILRFHFLFFYWLHLQPGAHRISACALRAINTPLIRGVAFIPSVLTASSPDQGGLPEQWQKPSLPIRKPSIIRRGTPLKRWRLRYGHQFPSQAATANHNQSIKAIYYCMLFGPDTPFSPVNSAYSTPFTRKVFYVHLLRFLLFLLAFVPVSGIAPEIIRCTG